MRFVADFLEHLEHCFVRAAVRRTPQARDARSNAGKRIGARRARSAHGRGGCILLVIRVQDQDAVDRAREDGIRLPLFAWRAEHHVQKILDVGQRVLRIHERLTLLYL